MAVQGSAVRSVTRDPITRVQLAKYAGASEDWNPIHIDPEHAKQVGLGDVIAHGMLTMAYMAQLARDLGGGSLKRIKVRFRSMVRVGDSITCSAEDVEETPSGIRMKLVATKQDGEVVASGEAEV